MRRETMIKAMRIAISNVMEKMFFQPLQFSTNNATLTEWFSEKGCLVGAAVDFNGPSEGSMYLVLPAAMGSTVAADFLGLENEEISEAQLRDTVSEALNMIGGQVLSLCDRSGAYTLGIPKFIEESELTRTRLEGLNGHAILIETDNNRFAVGILVNSNEKGTKGDGEEDQSIGN